MIRKSAFYIVAAAWCLSACASLGPSSLRQDSLSTQEHKTLGDTYLAQNEKNLAIQQYQAALHRDPHFVPALMALGNIAFEERKWKESRAYFRRVLKASPGDAAASNNLAMVYLAEGRHLDQARQLIAEALPRAGPLTPYLLDTSASLDILAGDYVQAKASLEQAQSAPPANDPEFTAHLKNSWQKWAEAVHSHSTSLQ